MRMAPLLSLLACAVPGVACAQKPAPMAIMPWASLAPVPGSAEARLGMRAQATRTDVFGFDGSETITVIGHKRAPIEAEELRREAPGAESWQSDAAQPVVPGFGDSCSYKSGCFDKQQKGLFDTLPSLLGDN